MSGSSGRGTCFFTVTPSEVYGISFRCLLSAFSSVENLALVHHEHVNSRLERGDVCAERLNFFITSFEPLLELGNNLLELLHLAKEMLVFRSPAVIIPFAF